MTTMEQPTVRRTEVRAATARTATAPAPASAPASRTAPTQERRHLRLNPWRSRWAATLEGSVYVAAAAGIAFMVADGALMNSGFYGWLGMMGRALGIVAAVMMMAMVLLASRAPWIERFVGHDHAIAAHTRYGITSTVVMLLHIVVVTISDAHTAGQNAASQLIAYWSYDWFMAWALISLGAILLTLATSFTAARIRIPYHQWHAIHLVTYIAVAAAVPHQFLQGSTFRDGGAAWWFWLALWVVSIGSFVWWRIGVPLVARRRHRAYVADVWSEADGSVTIAVAGRGLARTRARAGQFVNLSFGPWGAVRETHPYSLSAAPGDTWQFTIKPLGDASAKAAKLAPGTAVWFEGPFGTFTHRERTGDDLVLVGAGVGLTPLVALLEDAPATGDIAMVVRGRRREELPLLDEIERLVHSRGARYSAIIGRRGRTWGSRHQEATFVGSIRRPDNTDVYICGPGKWADQVEEDVLRAGVPAHAVHREEYSW